MRVHHPIRTFARSGQQYRLGSELYNMISNECGPPMVWASTVRPRDVRVHKKSVEKNVDRLDHLGDRKQMAVIARAANVDVPIVRVATQFDNTEEVQVGNRRHNPTSW